MEIYLIDENKLKIVLTRQDVRELDFPCENIHRDPRSREVLIALLEQGRLETGFHPSKTKLIVEVLPHENGGCVVCFTALQNTHFPLRNRGIHPVVFEFDCSDDLIEGSCRAFSKYSHRIYKSSLYRFENRYRLIIYPLDYSDRLSVYFLSEYGKNLGEDELLAAYTEEHGHALIRDNALDLLSLHFGEEGRAQKPTP